MAALDGDLDGVVDHGAVLPGERGGDREVLSAQAVVVLERQVGGERGVRSLGEGGFDGFEGRVGDASRNELVVTPFLIAVSPSRMTVMPSPWSTSSASGQAALPCETR